MTIRSATGQEVTDPYAKWTDDELGAAIKKKNPGVYDKWEDGEIGKAIRVKGTPQLGDVSKQARKNLANIQSEQARAQSDQDYRDIRSQYIREVATPVLAAGATLATGGAALLPAMALAGGTMAAGETAAQISSPTDAPEKDIAMATALGGLSEFGGRLIGGALVKSLGARAAAATGANRATYEAIAEKLGFPMKNVETKTGASLQARVDAARRAAVQKEADEILRPFGSPITMEVAGRDVAGVFKNVDNHYVQHARDQRDFIKQAIGNIETPLRSAAREVAKIRQELGKRVFPGRADVDEFIGAMVDESGAFKKFSLEELLALRTDIGREGARVSERSAKKTFFDRLYGAVSNDIETAIAARDPRLLDVFRDANKDFSGYYTALKNEVASRMWNAAKEGNGTAVVREFFKGAPEDMRHVLQFVQDTRPQEMGLFRQTLQRAALQEIFGIADDGAPALGFKLAERLDKIGADRLNQIFAGSQQAAETIGRVKELAQLTSRFERSLKMPPDMSRQLDSGVKRLLMQAGAALGAKAWGAPYAAARIGAEVLRGGADLILAELAVRPELFRSFKAGYQKMASAVSTANLSPQARAALTSGGEKEMKRALTGAASLAAIKFRTQTKREEQERAAAAKRQSVSPYGVPAQ